MSARNISDAHFWTDFSSSGNFTRYNRSLFLSFNPVVDLLPVILASYLVIFVIGSIGNLLVIYIIGRFSKVRVQSVANYYIWNLAFADFFFLCTLPFFCYASYSGNWPFGNSACKLSYAIREGNKFVGVYTLVALSLDRYTASYYSLNFLRTILVGKLVCASIWITSILLTTPYWLYAQTVTSKFNRTSCRLVWPSVKLDGTISMKTWTYFQFFVGFLLPFWTIFTAYLALGFRLRMMLSKGSRVAVKRPGHMMTHMTIVISFTFLFTQLPYYVMELANHAKGEEHKTRQLQHISQHEVRTFLMLTAFAKILVFMSSCCNPLIYGLLNKNYRQLYTETVCCWCRKVYPTEVLLHDLTSCRKRMTVSYLCKRGEWTTSIIPDEVELKELPKHDGYQGAASEAFFSGRATIQA